VSEEVEKPVEFEQAVAIYIKKGYRIYVSDEKNIQDFIYLMEGFGMSRKAIKRAFDVIIFYKARTVVEILTVESNGEMVSRTSYKAGKYQGHSMMYG